MFPILVALGLVAGLVSLASRQKEMRAAAEEARLARLRGRDPSVLTLDEAEDGVALARRRVDPAAEAYFRKIAAALKGGRQVR